MTTLYVLIKMLHSQTHKCLCVYSNIRRHDFEYQKLKHFRYPVLLHCSLSLSNGRMCYCCHVATTNSIIATYMFILQCQQR